MIDTGISPKVSSPETNYAASATSAGKSEGRGFYETLNNVGQQAPKPERQADADGHAKPAPNDEGLDVEAQAQPAENAAESAPTRTTKPIIDIRYGAPAPTTKAGGPEVPLPGTSTMPSGEGDEPRLTVDDGKIKQIIEALGEAETRPVKGKPAAGMPGQGKTGDAGKGDKTDRADKTKAGVETLVAEPADNPLGEMLSLLTTGGEQPVAGKDQADPSTLLKGAAGKHAVDPDGVVSKNSLADGLAAGTKSVVGLGEDDAAMLAGETDGADQAFRLVRADGKGQALNIRGGAQAGEVQTDRAATAREAAPTVTILDARRFLAPVSDSNASNISAAFLGDSSWVEAMGSHAALDEIDAQMSGAGKVVNTLKIQMSPIDLGMVTASLRLSGETLSIQLTVESPAAMRKLNEDSSEIIKALKAHGFAVDQIQINVAPSGRADSDASQQQQQQSAGQQTAQGGGQGGPNGQRQEPGLAAREFGNAMGIKTDEPVATQGPQGGSDGTRPSHVYI